MTQSVKETKSTLRRVGPESVTPHYTARNSEAAPNRLDVWRLVQEFERAAAIKDGCKCVSVRCIHVLQYEKAKCALRDAVGLGEPETLRFEDRGPVSAYPMAVKRMLEVAK